MSSEPSNGIYLVTESISMQSIVATCTRQLLESAGQSLSGLAVSNKIKTLLNSPFTVTTLTVSCARSWDTEAIMEVKLKLCPPNPNFQSESCDSSSQVTSRPSPHMNDGKSGSQKSYTREDILFLLLAENASSGADETTKTRFELQLRLILKALWPIL